MTQEDKELLLKDLCARLPYSVIVHCTDNDTDDYNCFLTTDILHEIQIGYEYYDYKPYLRPMSSMTEEEKEEFDEVLKSCNNKVFACPDKERRYNFFDAEQEDFMNAHHFDYRGLIEKGLALEATDGMYKQ